MFTELCILQIILILSIVFFNNVSTLFAAWTLSGVYLLGVGALLLVGDADILTGFLWIIDLGVGLVFLIFISYLFAFLNQTATVQIPEKISALSVSFFFAVFIFFTYLSFPTSISSASIINFSWLFLLSWYDYYDFFYIDSISDLQVLRELYFHSTALEFFIINFVAFYGIIAVVLLSIVVKRSVHYHSRQLYATIATSRKANTAYFFRSQNFIKQRSASASSRVWFKRQNSL